MSDTPITDANVCITTKEGCETIAPDICRTLERENAAMRKAIREAHESIDMLITAASGGMQPANGRLTAIKNGNSILSKLQPFLKL